MATVMGKLQRAAWPVAGFKALDHGSQMMGAAPAGTSHTRALI
jgi:hypothetical protein